MMMGAYALRGNWEDNTYMNKQRKTEIKAEIDEVKGTISNEKLWALADDIHYENIAVLEEYLEVLEEMLNNKEEN